MNDAHATPDFTIRPATADRWLDLEALFGVRGACGGCWCMVWRLKRAEFDAGKGETNRLTLKELVDSNAIPGLLGYMGERPIAWCAVAPREQYPALERSRLLRRVDDEPVWSVACLLVARPFRRQGITVRMLTGAVLYAGQRGARIVEGYPVEPQTADMPAVFAWTGTASAFRKAGFAEVLRRSPTRPIMRYVLR